MKDYGKAVKNLLQGENLERLQIEGKPYFSWRPCECCSGLKGGDRYRAIGFSAATGAETELRYDLCPGCAGYVMQESD